MVVVVVVLMVVKVVALMAVTRMIREGNDVDRVKVMDRGSATRERERKRGKRKWKRDHDAIRRQKLYFLSTWFAPHIVRLRL